MDILGVGFPELVLIFVIILLVMGPEDMQKTARNLGRWIGKVRSSEVWRSLDQLRRETRRFLYRVEQEAQLGQIREIDRALAEETRQAMEFKPLEGTLLPKPPHQPPTPEAAPLEVAGKEHENPAPDTPTTSSEETA